MWASFWPQVLLASRHSYRLTGMQRQKCGGNIERNNVPAFDSISPKYEPWASLSFTGMSNRLSRLILRRKEAILREMVMRAIGPTSHELTERQMLASLEEHGMEALVVEIRDRGEWTAHAEIRANGELVESQPFPDIRFTTP